MTIGLMGGTFDPIHNAHILIARAALDAFALDRVIFIPTGDPPHKCSVADKRHRLRMAELAVEGQPGFSVSPIEVEREGVTYTIDTLRTIRRSLDGSIYYIVGADTLMDLGSWREIDAVMEICEIIAFHRTSVTYDSIAAQSDWIGRRFSKHPKLLPVSAPDISSTQIRARLAKGEPIDDMVPQAVTWYIKKHRIYMPASGEQYTAGIMETGEENT